MKMKKTPKFKQKALLEVEEVEQKGVGQGGGKPQPLGRSPPSGGISKGRGRVPTSSKPMGVLGRHSSGHKHNPFSALATAAKQSAKAAKRKMPPWDPPDYDDGDEWKRARKDSESVGKAPHKQLPYKLPKKSQGARPSWHSQGPSRSLIDSNQAQWHSNKLGSTKGAQSCCAGNCVSPG